MKVALDGPARERAEESGRLKGLAQGHASEGRYLEAASLHRRRGALHAEAGEYKEAFDAHGAALDCMSRMLSKG
jgi:hypothetical protein